MTDLLNALLLGIIEGITEFLPISSTGHLLIAERWLGHRSDLFNIGIQAGAILAVVLIYRQRLWQLAMGFLRPVEKTSVHGQAPRDYALKLVRRLRRHRGARPGGQEARLRIARTGRRRSPGRWSWAACG